MKLVYENKLSCENDVKDFVLEGSAEIYFENGKMRMKNALSADLGQKSNFVYWCNEDFPSDVQIEWEFRPIEEPGLAILFFSAKGVNGEDLFDPSLQMPITCMRASCMYRRQQAALGQRKTR